jgi:lysophospholipase L1-like esterase
MYTNKQLFEKMMNPIWSSKVMYYESVLMLQEEGKLPEATLLFTPKKIISVYDAQLLEEYEEGRDWFFEEGKLKLTPHSRANYLTEQQLFPDSFKENKTYPREGNGYILLDTLIHNQQLAVTYEHSGEEWTLQIPGLAKKQLPRLFSKLEAGEALKIVLYGDSISVGADSSGWTKLPPFLPPWGELVIQRIEQAYPSSQINFVNPSVGGKDTIWGKENVQELVASEQPDLVIIAFGMNDGGRKFPPQTFKENIINIMDVIKHSNPDVEFILVTTSLPNPYWSLAREGQQLNYLPIIKGLERSGVAVADVTSVHVELLKRKKYSDMTGNNVNHPNDFLARIYAQVVSSLLVQ